MKITPLLVVNTFAAVVGLLAPVVLSAYVTQREALRNEENRALSYALDVLARSEAVTNQIDVGIKRLVASGASNPCSTSNQELMKEIDLSSSYIQAMGHIAGNQIVCSSLGVETGSVDLGPADMVRASGVRLWLNVQFPFARNAEFLAVERDGYVAIVHKDLPIDATTDVDGVSLATVTYPEAQIVTGRGAINPAWLAAIDGKSKTFISNGYVVAIAAPKRYYIGAISAVPTRELDKRIYSTSLITIPVGILASLLLAWSVFRIAKTRTAMPAVIKSALKQREFFLEYQPLVELATGRWIGAEALIRWRRTTGEVVPPDIFIPVAEACGLIQQISQYVAKQFASEAGDLFRRYPGFHVGINVAAADIHDEATVLMFRELAAATGAGRNNIIVEATERSFTDHSRAATVIKQMRQEGFPVAIDDFGTGYSSLAYLERIRFDYLKIDKSFVDTVNTDAATSGVVLHIIEMAKALNIEMIAEGVETELQAQFLYEQGVRFGQGWLFGKPMPFSQLLEGLEKSMPMANHQADSRVS